MSPLCDQILKTVAATLATEHVPNASTDHERLGLVFSMFLLGAASEEFDRAAHRRVEENRALRKIFSESLSVIEEPNLRNQLREAAETTEDDYRIPALDELNCALQETLIELHAHVETLEGEKARAVETTIWRELEEWTKRREFSIWDMAMAMMAVSAQEQALENEENSRQEGSSESPSEGNGSP